MTDTVTIPREEYERLNDAAEMLADVRAFDRAMAENREAIPAEFVNRIIAGESPVRALRDWRGLTGAALAEAAGLHRVQVHDIESGKRGGSIATMKKLADALGVTVDDLV